MKKISDKNYVYNEVYEGKQGTIFVAAVLSLFIPEAADYDVPICIEISSG